MKFTGAAPDGAPRGMPPAGQGAGRPGQVRTWHFFHRHTVLSMCALALLAAAADPGMVKGSVPEARRLLRLATTPATAARQLGHAWSRRRRRHQARARFHHYQARLMSA